ncbi:stage VI sporulation protein F [Halobacillus litoralis]|uniref:Stage VI sporulation protein F n=4 Tax=Halobacillus TaxID=45667 RepID=A0A845FA22_9BACI|nr:MULTISPECIES: stage VI sporulation protein F [Halobacillus]MBN9653085.1 stage VI sporulation protein F [Halobacillus sp. GSS1]MBX0356210.1 stage VI sporulation protein F [Halobacillus sp. Nhm2S1]MEC3885846.1 stage VI sporulation protein F [Halobacillus sp. HZG1]MYL48457.1 stage VI sporulation protein F [Halobacillus litoralis]MYL71212.1 stage VI sporulation protein F [Halobacillus litoralis]
MNDFQKNIFDHLKKKANIDPEDVFKVANSVQNADFSDEKTVRRLVRQLAKVANKNVSKSKEDKIVEAITKQNMPLDMNTLGKFLK